MQQSSYSTNTLPCSISPQTIPPWRADISVYFNTFFVQDRENIQSELSSYSPDYILITTESPGEWHEDTWAFYRQRLSEIYIQSERVGDFDLLERSPNKIRITLEHSRFYSSTTY